MRMITGFIPPSEGEVFVGGFNMLDNPIPAKSLIGYLPGKCAFLHRHDGPRIPGLRG